MLPLPRLPCRLPTPGGSFTAKSKPADASSLIIRRRTGIKSQNGQALGKYYEYSDIKPGPFGQFWLNGQTKDGLYNFNVWGDNVGYNDQRYEADVSKAGEHYFDVIWDQTPHVYSTNALTLYSGIGGPALVLPPGLSNTLFDDCRMHEGRRPSAAGVCTSGNPLRRSEPQSSATITNNLYTTDIGIRRDTAAVAYRWTPTDAWDINVAYMNMHRWGTQVEGVVFSPGTSGVAAQVPKPVNDTTQNFGVNGEYKGTSPWGKSFTFKLGYAGSIFTKMFELLYGAESVLRRHNSAIDSRGGPMRAQRLSRPARSL